MNIKNYTSSTPASQSISRIEDKLRMMGAKSINKEFTADQQLAGIKFVIEINDHPVCFELPANIPAVFSILRQKVKKHSSASDKRCREQAERTAWKLLFDWVEVQCSMIYLQQAEILQVFMPYAMMEDKSLYRTLKESGFKMLN